MYTHAHTNTHIYTLTHIYIYYILKIKTQIRNVSDTRMPLWCKIEKGRLSTYTHACIA